MTSRSGFSAKYLLAAVAATVVVVGGGLAVFGMLRDDGSSSSAASASQPFTAPLGGSVSPVERSKVRVEASSFLEPDGSISYNPENVLDGDELTAWNSSQARDEGRGQTLTFRFTEPVDLRGLRFVNGYAKDAAIYAANHRIKEMIIVTDTGNQRVSLLDTKDRQEIQYEFGLTSKVRLEIVDVFPGSGFENPELTADLAVSEVAFMAVQP